MKISLDSGDSKSSSQKEGLFYSQKNIKQKKNTWSLW